MNNGPRTINEAADLLRRGELTPTALLDCCLARIDCYEPKVQAWAYLDREGAYAQAKQRQAELKRGESRGPLHGIPIGIKDIIDVFDLPTSCGSRLWANSYARRDAPCVQRLRQAGAVILGKTVTTAYASFDPSSTRNPWKLEHTPGGSSSGSAAAVACGMCLGALGSQTGGSLTRPASYCGVYSLKPTYGRVSVAGILPLAPSLDHVGVMANGVLDLAIVFQSIAGPSGDPDDYFRDTSQPIPECVAETDRQWTAPKVPIVRLRGMFEESVQPELLHQYLNVLGQLEAAWAPLHSIALPSSFTDISISHRVIMAVQAAAYHVQRMDKHPDDYPAKIRELIEYGLASRGVTYHKALCLRDQLRREASAMFGRGTVFVTPATRDFAPTLETTGDPSFNSPWSFTGLPTLSIPVGWSNDGLPHAIQLIANHGHEGDLCAVAAWCEQVIGFTPRILPL